MLFVEVMILYMYSLLTNRMDVVLLNYTVDQTHIRSINQRVILNRIIHTDTISRADLSRQVRISKSAITEIIASLLDIGIIREVGEGSSTPTGGRKPILLKFNKFYKYIIAIDLSYEDPILALANLGGEIVNEFSVNIDYNSSYNDRFELMKNAISELIALNHLTYDDLAIIAISSPGIFMPESKEFKANPQFENWRMSDLSKELEEHFGTSVMVINDVNSAAVGEHKYGIGRGVNNLLYVSCGLGVGAGIIINGSLYEGVDKSAGEIGSFRVPNGDEYTTLERKININALMRRIAKEAPKETLNALVGPDKSAGALTFKNIVRVWKRGDKFLEQCICDIAIILGNAISNMISLLNFELVILGGEYHVFSDQMLPIINHIIKENAFSYVETVGSSLVKYPGIYGLFALSNDIILDQLCSATTQGKINNRKKA